MSEAIFMTQGFAYDSAQSAEARFKQAGDDEFIYARYGNPTVRMFEERIASLEGAEDGFATASGMAAVHGALAALLRAGDHVVAARALFGSCLYVLEEVLMRFGVNVTFIDGLDLAAWKEAITSNTKLVFFESISNPTLEVIDIKAVSTLAHSCDATVVVDNVFSTPVYSKAIELGADLVIYSATKHIDGQGRGLGGVILGSHNIIRGAIEPFMKHTGGAMSPFNAWMMLKSLETLDLRVREQTKTALCLAKSLASRSDLKRVIYPFLPSHPQFDLTNIQMGAGGTVLSIDVGSKARAFAVMNAFEIVLISNNLGDAKSIVAHPATTTHQRLPQDHKDLLGITAGLLRLSIGLESEKDLLEDLNFALDVDFARA
jgi:O-succinylhomoserine sulfhydrylase